MKKQILSEEFKRMQKLAGLLTEEEQTTLAENQQPKIGDKVDVFNPKRKYSGWGSDEYLYNAEVVKINGQKLTVKDLNDDEYEVDLVDIGS